MENVAKALLIAGGVLLGILLLTLMVYVFTQASAFIGGQVDRQKTIELNIFNTKFLAYDRENLTANDILSVTNLALNEFAKDSSAVVVIDCDGLIMTSRSAADNINFVKTANSIEPVRMYRCISKDTLAGKITKMIFVEQTPATITTPPYVTSFALTSTTNSITATAGATDSNAGLLIYKFSIKKSGEADVYYIPKQEDTLTTCTMSGLDPNTNYTVKVEVTNNDTHKTGTVADMKKTQSLVAVNPPLTNDFTLEFECFVDPNLWFSWQRTRGCIIVFRNSTEHKVFNIVWSYTDVAGDHVLSTTIGVNSWLSIAGQPPYLYAEYGYEYHKFALQDFSPGKSVNYLSMMVNFAGTTHPSVIYIAKIERVGSNYVFRGFVDNVGD